MTFITPTSTYPLATPQSQWDLPGYLTPPLNFTRDQPLELIPQGQRYPLAEVDFSITNIICGIAKWLFGYRCEQIEPIKMLKDRNIVTSSKIEKSIDLINSTICQSIPDPDCPPNVTNSFGEVLSCTGERKYLNLDETNYENKSFFWRIQVIPYNDIIPTIDQKQCIIETFNNWLNLDQSASISNNVTYFRCLTGMIPQSSQNCKQNQGDYGIPYYCDPLEYWNDINHYDLDGDTRTLILNDGQHQIGLKVSFGHYDCIGCSQMGYSFGTWNAVCENKVISQLNQMFRNSLCYHSTVSDIQICLSDDHFTTTTTTTTMSTSTTTALPTTTSTTSTLTTTTSATTNSSSVSDHISPDTILALNITNMIISSSCIFGYIFIYKLWKKQ